MDIEIPPASSEGQTHRFHQPLADRETQTSHQLSQTDGQKDPVSLALPGRHRDPISLLRQMHTKSSATSPDSGIRPAVTAHRRRQRGPGPQAAGHTDKGMRLPRHQDGRRNPARVPTSRPGSPDRQTGSGCGGPAAGPVSPLAGGNPSPARLTRCRRGRREPQTDKGQRTDGWARWRRATPACTTRARARGHGRTGTAGAGTEARQELEGHGRAGTAGAGTGARQEPEGHGRAGTGARQAPAGHGSAAELRCRLSVT